MDFGLRGYRVCCSVSCLNPRESVLPIRGVHPSILLVLGWKLGNRGQHLGLNGRVRSTGISPPGKRISLCFLLLVLWSARICLQEGSSGETSHVLHTWCPGQWDSVAAASLVLSHIVWPLLTEVGLPFAFPLLLSLLSSTCQQLILGGRAGLADTLGKTRKSPILSGL